MRSLPEQFRAQLKKLNNDQAFLLLYEIRVGGGDMALHVVNNEEPVTFDGLTYQPFPITIGQTSEDTETTLPTPTLTVANITREVQAFILHYRGLLDETVFVRLVSEATLGDSGSVDVFEAQIEGLTSDREKVVFTLTQLQVLNLDFPNRRFARARCPFVWGSKECGWGYVPGLPGLNPPSGVQIGTPCDKGLDTPSGCRVQGQKYTDAGHTALHPDRFGAITTLARRRAP